MSLEIEDYNPCSRNNWIHLRHQDNPLHKFNGRFQNRNSMLDFKIEIYNEKLVRKDFTGLFGLNGSLCFIPLLLE